jgi:hypothetical protein
MKMRIYVFTFVLLAMVIMPSTACTSRAIATEAAQSLIQTNKLAVENIDSEITTLNQQLHDIQAQQLKLEQVLGPALDWVDYQKTQAKPGMWKAQVDPTGLEKFQNDRYQVAALEVITTKIDNALKESSSTVKIRDLTTQQITDGETIRAGLANSKIGLEAQRQARLDARELAASTMSNILKYISDWKTKKVSDTIYSVSGPGLGWSESLTAGVWEFDRDRSTMVPSDKPAEDLNTIIRVELPAQ